MLTSAFFSGFLPAIPSLIAWTAAIVLSIMMLKKGGGRPEKFLLAGSCLMLVSALIPAPLIALIPSLIAGGATNMQAATVASIFNIASGIFGAGGIICLIYAFWQKFKAKPDVQPQ